ncbi:uncharacterized protein UV8b_01800 [Ustilaginoidea virens]|uniref:Uncharacterized protein n=1 Tax=Ustilaginoidea virens TaxID=1159556 RepID=A0A8E5HLG2_USTVR|nr:uncharacterized protein UV8b_01800 [Ustilaginoidea virens]QUC17559.1 hypothetical protein UV8b_01800 [Ustilaginoidea virens]
MHEITSFRQEVRSQFTAIDAKFEAMDAKFQAMDAKFQAMNRNLTSRQANQWAVSGGVSLLPMYNIFTGNEIANCPQTLAALEQCNGKYI